MYHFVNDLLPNGCPPRNLQLYFFDTEHELENRLQGADRMDRDIVSALIQLMSGNPYGQFFRSLKDIAQTDEFSIILRSDISMDQRTHNMPSASQVAAIWIEDNGDGLDGNRNIRVHSHSGRSQYIQYYYGCYDPLQYPLLFPHGDIGWHEGIQRVSSREHVGTTGSRQSANINPNNINSIDELIQAKECVFTEGRKRASVSCREYYAYKFQVRLSMSTQEKEDREIAAEYNIQIGDGIEQLVGSRQD
nr:uncharacterized protein LOC109176597 [Ipomoea batatas]